MVYSIQTGGRKGSRILFDNHAIVLHQGGQCRWAEGVKGWLIRAQQPQSKRKCCDGFVFPVSRASLLLQAFELPALTQLDSFKVSSDTQVSTVPCCVSSFLFFSFLLTLHIIQLTPHRLSNEHTSFPVFFRASLLLQAFELPALTRLDSFKVSSDTQVSTVPCWFPCFLCFQG